MNNREHETGHMTRERHDLKICDITMDRGTEQAVVEVEQQQAP